MSQVRLRLCELQCSGESSGRELQCVQVRLMTERAVYQCVCARESERVYVCVCVCVCECVLV